MQKHIILLLTSILIGMNGLCQNNIKDNFQNGIIQGKITDFINDKPLQNAKIDVYKCIVDVKNDSISIHRYSESIFITTLYSDSIGKFSLSVKINSNYDFFMIHASCSGYIGRYKMHLHVKEKQIANIELSLDKENPSKEEKEIMDKKYDLEKQKLEQEKSNFNLEPNIIDTNQTKPLKKKDNILKSSQSCVYTVPLQVQVTNLVEDYNSPSCNNSGGVTELMDFDTYIAGVVADEMGNFPLEAKKAQAVASRTYSLYNINNLGKSANCGQGYYDNPSDISIQAATSTSTQVILYNNSLVQPLYSARCNGDYTQNANQGVFNTEDCIESGNAIKYMVSVKCSGHINCNNTNETPCCNVLISTTGKQGFIYGHGVGMCQRGAQDYANQGQTYNWILNHYYTGICIANSSCIPVSITSQPQSQFAPVGGTATFNVTVSGTPPISYQWYENDDPIEDATNSSDTVNIEFKILDIKSSYTTNKEHTAYVELDTVINNNTEFQNFYYNNRGDDSIPTINFKKYTLIYLANSCGGCKPPDFNVTINKIKSSKKYIINYNLYDYGNCETYYGTYKWILVPKIEKGYQVKFNITVTHM